jgi:hypothetical protein
MGGVGLMPAPCLFDLPTSVSRQGRLLSLDSLSSQKAIPIFLFCFALMPQLVAVFVSGFGCDRFSTGPAQSLPTRLGHAALAVADDGGSGA